MKSTFNSLIFAALLVIILSSTPTKIFVYSQRQRSRTVTAPLIRTTQFILRDFDLAALRFQKVGVFPRAFLTLELPNSTFSTASPECQAALRLDNFGSLVTGDGWLSSELFPEVPITQTSEDSNRATVFFKGSALFDARKSLSEKTQYTLRLPSACVSQQASAPFRFRLADTPTSQLSGILAFTLLLAGTLGFIAVLGGGSAYAYVPVQLAAMLTSCGCGPIDLQAESYTVLFTISPLPYTSRSRMPHYNMLLTNLLIFLILAVLEALYFAVRWVNTKAYAPRLLASLRGRRDVFLSSYKPQPDETRPIPHEDIPKRPMPFYFLFAMFVTLGTGTFFNAVRVLSFEASDIKHYGAAGVGIIVWFLLFAFCLSLSLSKGAYFVNYSTSKKKLPSFITPSGCVGPNVFRLSFGPVVNDMKQNRRAFSTFSMIYLVIMSIMIGATQPSAASCRTTLSIAWLFTFLFGVFIYKSRPLRTAVSNILIITCLIAALFAIASQLMYGGYGGNANGLDHWSGRMGVIALIVLAIVSTFNSLVAIIVGFWEGIGGEAQRTGKYSDGLNGGGGAGGAAGDLLAIGVGGGGTVTGENVGAGGAEQFERHVAFLIGEMKQIIEDGGGQPLEPDDHFIPGVTGSSAKKGGSSHLQAPTLSQFLLQDFDALPRETQESLITSERIAHKAQLSKRSTSAPNPSSQARGQRRSPSQAASPSYSYL